MTIDSSTDDDPSGTASAAGDDEKRKDDTSVGQVLGTSVPVSTAVTQAEPGTPETGARRGEDGKPIA